MEENKTEITIEEQENKRKQLSRFRIFWLLFALNVLLFAYFIYEIIYLCVA